jgi:hypothetical protein
MVSNNNPRAKARLLLIIIDFISLHFKEPPDLSKDVKDI